MLLKRVVKASASSERTEKPLKSFRRITMAETEIRLVSSKSDLMKFIKLPWKIYKDDPYWVPPLIMDRKKLLDKKKNPFFKHAEMELMLAYKNGDPVGRIAAITNA
jgi:hypothetical protein